MQEAENSSVANDVTVSDDLNVTDSDLIVENFQNNSSTESEVNQTNADGSESSVDSNLTFEEEQPQQG